MTQNPAFILRLRAFTARLRGNTSGVAIIEFAYSLPLLMGVGGFGLEMSNLAITNQKISQASTALADNMSRVGERSSLSVTQLRESDVNDGFIGAQKQTNGLNLTTRGRIILSSLERNTSNGQWIHWQRCLGTKNVGSTYGTQGTGSTGTAFAGMGPSTARITAPADSAVMFVEIKYDYQPLFGTMYIPAREIKYEASFIVRDDRDMSGAGIFNPSPAAAQKLCTAFTAN